MKLICNKDSLQSAVTNVSRAVSAKSAMSSLEGILLKAEGSTLTLSGYDLDLGITTVIDAQVSEEGSIVLSAKIFGDMIRKLPDSRVEISCNEKMLTNIRCGVTEYTILATPSLEFPELPRVEEGQRVLIGEEKLRTMIHQTIFSVATNDAKPVHTGCLFDYEDGVFNVVAVDGFRMAIRRETLDYDGSFSFIVPGKSLTEVEKLLGEDKEEEVELVFSGRHIIFQIGSYQLISRLLEGEFLDYKAAIPKTGVTEVKIGVRPFISSLERTSLLISDRLKSPLRLLIGEDQIKISCSTALGRAYDEIGCQISGQSFEMGFNNKFLLDALKAVDGDEIKMEIGGPLSPMKILPLEGDSFVFLVLPVRLKNEL